MAVLLIVALATMACARPALREPVAPTAAVRDFSFATDTFAFRNEIRARKPDVPDLYAHHCFVLARAIRQFHATARFDPAAPRLDHAGYVERVRMVAARSPWDAPLPPDARVVIPGYANLREFSRGEEAAVKTGLGGPFWTVVHWTLWRVTFPVTRGHQETVAEEIKRELASGRLVQLLVTNWPKPELNHGVIAFGYRETATGVEFTTWDPNDPDDPGTITFERAPRRFFATRVYATAPGPIRAFRMTYSWFL